MSESDSIINTAQSLELILSIDILIKDLLVAINKQAFHQEEVGNISHHSNKEIDNINFVANLATAKDERKRVEKQRQQLYLRYSKAMLKHSEEILVQARYIEMNMFQIKNTLNSVEALVNSSEANMLIKKYLEHLTKLKAKLVEHIEVQQGSHQLFEHSKDKAEIKSLDKVSLMFKQASNLSLHSTILLQNNITKMTSLLGSI